MPSEVEAELIQLMVRASAGTSDASWRAHETPPFVALTLAAQRQNDLALHLLLALVHCSDESTSAAAARALCATANSDALLGLALIATRRHEVAPAVQRLIDTKGVVRAARSSLAQVQERLAHRGHPQTGPSPGPQAPPCALEPEDDTQAALLRASELALEKARSDLIERLPRYEADIARTWGWVECIGTILRISQRLEVIARESIQLVGAQLGMEGDQLVRAVTGSTLSLGRSSLGILLLVLSRISPNEVCPAQGLHADASATDSVLGRFVAVRNRIVHQLDASGTVPTRSAGAEDANARRASRQVLRQLGDILRWLPSDWTVAHIEAVDEPAAVVFPSSKLRRFAILDELHIGRHRDADVRVDSDVVSRSHLTIRGPRDGQPAVLQDHSSSGTLLNGMPVDGKADLADGDSITVGPVTFVYRRGQ
ncbi:MAG: FHA domain-containing protein [Myxococcales bacterium]|nr:FHA domain-containing protein [Myxococcales bacterium]